MPDPEPNRNWFQFSLRLLLLLVILPLVTTTAIAQSKTKSGKTSIEGAWVLHSIEYASLPVPGLSGATLIFEQGRKTFTLPGGQVETGSYSVDLTQDPPHIDSKTKDASAPSWPEWGRMRYGLQGDLLDHGPRYPNHAMAIQAALDGQGVALCALTLVIDDLVAGHLVAPLRSASAVKTDFAYRMVWATARRQSATQKTFMRWIEEEAAKTNEVITDFLS